MEWKGQTSYPRNVEEHSAKELVNLMLFHQKVVIFREGLWGVFDTPVMHRVYKEYIEQQKLRGNLK